MARRAPARTDAAEPTARSIALSRRPAEASRLVPAASISLVQEPNLKLVGKDPSWLRETLRRRGFTDLRKVLYGSIEESGRLYVQSRDGEAALWEVNRGEAGSEPAREPAGQAAR